ncbi:phage tail protein [Escherichia coli]
MPVPWPTATPPAGWLKCDGRAFTKRTISCSGQSLPDPPSSRFTR